MQPNASASCASLAPHETSCSPSASGSTASTSRCFTHTIPAADGASALLILGWPDVAWHLELVQDPTGKTSPRPTDEDLLVLYLGGPIDDDLIERLIAAGGQRVPSRNPYWDQWGVTLQDPDGYRLVLSDRTWP
jgi:hypothetical protein